MKAKIAWLMLSCLLALALLVVSCTPEVHEEEEVIDEEIQSTPTPLPLGTLVVTADTAIPAETFGDRLIEVTVISPGIADASARLRVTGEGTAGTILLISGGRGTAMYRPDGEAEWEQNISGMVDTLLDDGYKLVEVAWDDYGVWMRFSI